MHVNGCSSMQAAWVHVACVLPHNTQLRHTSCERCLEPPAATHDGVLTNGANVAPANCISLAHALGLQELTRMYLGGLVRSSTAKLQVHHTISNVKQHSPSSTCMPCISPTMHTPYNACRPSPTLSKTRKAHFADMA